MEGKFDFLTNFEDFSHWFNAHPMLERRILASMISSRVALRVLPLIVPWKFATAKLYAEHVCIACWRICVARRNTVPIDAELAKAAAAAYEALFTFQYPNSEQPSYHSEMAEDAARSAAKSLLVSDSYVVFEAIQSAFASLEVVPSSERINLIDEIHNDIDIMRYNTGWQRVLREPSWHLVSPNIERVIQHFRDTVTAGEHRDQGLALWRDWYQAASLGLPAFGLTDSQNGEALERAIALGSKGGNFSEDFWKREPSEINREIAQWVEEALAAEAVGGDLVVPAEPDFPAQSIEATMFGLDADGRIARVAVPPEQQLLITPQQQLEYQALREDSLELAGRGQVLGQLGAQVEALLLSLPSDMSHARVFDVWRALNRLRRTMNAHQRVADFPEPHEAKLEPAIAEDLAALLRTANIFAFGDPGLLRRDELAIAPQDRPALQAEKSLGDDLAAAAQNMPEMFTDDALGSVVAEEANAAGAGDDQHGLQAIDQTNKTRRNWIAVILGGLKAEGGFAWKEMRSGAYKKTGEAGSLAAGIAVLDVIGVTAVYPAIWKFVSLHGANLLSYVKSVYQNPTLTAFVEQVLRSVGL